ncbi:hypothetical protein AAFF_G00201610 [Aldrovandia affinis]|uniref:Uncharacterized protein n=1 Tax=Aldrovandia affinis TaxID=143900 RepID=A0AAD7SWU4_9TELE|nr:hypothetical protein AAFF_G00201610 [Aldrovandia affinis]
MNVSFWGDLHIDLEGVLHSLVAGSRHAESLVCVSPRGQAPEQVLTYRPLSRPPVTSGSTRHGTPQAAVSSEPLSG